MYSAWSTVYLTNEVNTYNCYIGIDDWRSLTERFTSNRLFALISWNNEQCICSLGEPIADTHAANNLYLPSWILNQLQIQGVGEELSVDWLSVEELDESTRIVLQPLDSAFIYGDIKTQMQNELTKLGVLQKNTVIYLKMPELDNYEIGFIVKELEPCNIVLCQGDEVVLEFEESLDSTSSASTEVIASVVTPSAPSVLDNPAPSAPNIDNPAPSAPPVSPSVERYNPWRSKDFKPRYS